MPQSLEIGWHRTFLIGMSTFQDVFKKKEGNEMKKKKKRRKFYNLGSFRILPKKCEKNLNFLIYIYILS